MINRRFQPKTQQRRGTVRRAVQVDCQVHSAYWEGPVEHLATNLSDDGVWLQSQLPLEEGEKVIVTLRPPFWRDSLPLSVLAQVARVGLYRRRGDERSAGMGLRFLGLDPARSDRLQASLRGLPPPFSRRTRAFLPAPTRVRALPPPLPKHFEPPPAIPEAFELARPVPAVPLPAHIASLSEAELLMPGPRTLLVLPPPLPARSPARVVAPTHPPIESQVFDGDGRLFSLRAEAPLLTGGAPRTVAQLRKRMDAVRTRIAARSEPSAQIIPFPTERTRAPEPTRRSSTA